jgi:hypothetical protein
MRDTIPLDLDFVDDWLAIGARVESAHGPALEAQGIRRVIDLRAELEGPGPDLVASGIARLHLPTLDLTAPTLSQLDEGVVWALEGRRAGDRVLVHCEHGVGRSAVLACCCLVALGHGPLQALSRAKDRRERVAPSPVQLEAYLDWARGRREGSGRRLEATSWEDLARVAYRHLVET